MSKESNSPGLPRIVGIGASAGGLEAIKEFFESTPADTGLVWVVVQHLSPGYTSVIGDLLTSSTRMPIHAADAGVEPKPDNLYLIPSSKNLRLDKSGKFTLDAAREPFVSKAVLCWCRASRRLGRSKVPN